MTIEIIPADVIKKLRIISDCEYDKDLEKILGLNRGALCSYKKRNALPYKEIAMFCLERNIEINYVLGKKVS